MRNLWYCTMLTAANPCKYTKCHCIVHFKIINCVFYHNQSINFVTNEKGEITGVERKLIYCQKYSQERLCATILKKFYYYFDLTGNEIFYFGHSLPHLRHNPNFNQVRKIKLFDIS